jgi:outer membrane protein assembly factor BamB
LLYSSTPIFNLDRTRVALSKPKIILVDKANDMSKRESTCHRFLSAIFVGLAMGVGTASADDSSPLRAAARRGDSAEVQRLIDAKEDINAASDYGVTALAMACDHGHEEVVRILIRAGADPNTKDRFYKFSPLGWATMRKHVSVVKLLVEGGATDVDTALGNAVGMQDEAIVGVLVGSGKVTDATMAKAIFGAKMMMPTMTDPKPMEAIIAILESKMSEPAKGMLLKLEADRAATQMWKDLLGAYKNDRSTLDVKVNDGQLTMSERGVDRVMPLEKKDANVFASGEGEIRFVRDGEVTVSLFWAKKDGDVGYVKLLESSETSSTASTAMSESASIVPTLAQDFPMTEENWPNFRGTLSRGINNGIAIPTQWNGKEGKNIAWKASIPGLATSSPIVVGNRVFLTTAEQVSDKSGFRTGAYGDVESVNSDGECVYQLMCLDLDTGSVEWAREAVREVPKVKRHAKSSHANSTPATDGRFVVAMFGGAGIYCYDMDGKLQWKRDLGMLDSGWFYDKSYQWGYGSSPFIFEDRVLVQCDVQEGSFLEAMDLATGKTVWRTPREEIPTWSSPVGFMAADGTPTVIATGTKCTAGYHARTGEKLWSMGGFSEIVVPTPQVMPDVVLLTSGYAPVQPIVALLNSARGELKIPSEKDTSGSFLWAQTRGGPYMPTPVVVDQKVYLLDNSGILTCVELATGKRVFRQRLRSEKASAYTSSPVASNGNLYCTSEEGLTFVVAMDDKGTVRSENELGEAVLTSPAISRGKLLLRGEKHLFAIQVKPEAN